MYWEALWHRNAYKATLFAVVCFLTIATGAVASVSVGGITYSIRDDHTASSMGPEMMEQHADGQFIIIRLSVHNGTNHAITVSDSDFHLKHGSTTYDASSQSALLDGAFFFTTINPGVTRTGSLAFDVPRNTYMSDYSLEVYGDNGVIPREMPL